MEPMLHFWVPSERYYAEFIYRMFRDLGWDSLIYKTNQIHELLRKEWYLPITVHNYKSFIRSQGNVFDNLSEDIINILDKLNGFILFDLSYEFLPSDPILFKEIHYQLSEKRIAPANVIIINGNIKSTNQYLIFCQSENIEKKMKIIGYDAFLYLYSGYCNKVYGHKRIEEIVRIYGKTYFKNSYREKHFLSFNRMPRPHRYAIMLFLIENNLLDKGLVSFPGHALPSTKTKSYSSKNISHPYFSKEPKVIHNILAERNISELFVQKEIYNNIKCLIDKCPIILDEDFQKEAENIAFDNYQTQLYTKSYLSIVTDTRFFEKDILFITEKVYKAIFNLHPFIYVGPSGSLAHLNALGFETFSPYIDESYDKISCPIKRMKAIFRLIEGLCSLQTSEIHNLYNEMWGRLLKNFYNLLYYQKTFFPDIIHNTLFKKIVD